MSKSTPTPADAAAASTEPNGTGETPGAATKTEPIKLPDDHPLVKAYEAEKAENQAKTAKIAEFEQAQMTEAEKAEARVRAAEERAAELEADNTRKGVALQYGLSADDVALLEGVTDPEAMKRIAERLSVQAAEANAPRTPQPHPAQRAGDAPVDDKDAVARAFFGL